MHSRIDSNIVRPYLSGHIELGQVDFHVAEVKRQASLGTRMLGGRLVLLLRLLVDFPDDGHDDDKGLDDARIL